MAKDTSLSTKKTKIPLFSRTVLKNASINIFLMTIIFIVFNLFTLIKIDHELEKDLDKKLAHEIEHLLNAFHFENDSLVIDNPKELRESDLISLSDNPYFLQVIDLKGRFLLKSPNISEFCDIPLINNLQTDEIEFIDKTICEESLRIGTQRIYNNNNKFSGIIQLSAPKSTALVIEKTIILFNLTTFPIAVMVIIIISVYISKRSYSPIRRIIELANHISATNLVDRLEYKAQPGEELAMLRDTLNHLFDRLEKQITNIKDFTNNASHQLMSPLTVINSELDFLLKRNRTNQEYVDTAKTIQRQTSGMITLVRTMLMLSRDSEHPKANDKIFSLFDVISNDVKQYYMNKNITYSLREEIYVRGDKNYFVMVINNLIDNAIKYSGEDYNIKIQTDIVEDHSIIKVIDNGPGIDNSEKEKIFEKFYRGKQTLEQKIEGNGLGLSLSKYIVEAMGGTIEAIDNNPSGTIFKISLPNVILQ